MSGYIGTQPVPQATQTRDSFTATSGQTSFATGGYTPNFLDVYLNGVKLASGASADYTATNGSDVVLASGAATGDILEVVAFTTFTPASIPDGTPSIDDNGDATAITIDSSERLLIGKTSTSFSTAGHRIDPDGNIEHIRSNNPPLNLNRKSSDGDIATFYKDGTTVGSIGVQSTDQLYIGTPDGSGVGLVFDGDNRKIDPTNGAGSNLDNAVDLGNASHRFKDAYLSGGVYLGGTAAANKLDDFEQGTFNLTLRSDGSEPSTKVTVPCNYIKVGNMVNFWGTQASINNTGYSGGMRFEGLPFAAPSPYSTGNIALDNIGNFGGSNSYGPHTMISGTIVYAIKHMNNASSWNFIQHNPVTTGGVYLCGAYIIS